MQTPGSEDDTGTPRRRRSFFANIDEEDDDEDEQGFMFAPDQVTRCGGTNLRISCRLPVYYAVCV